MTGQLCRGKILRPCVVPITQLAVTLVWAVIDSFYKAQQEAQGMILDRVTIDLVHK
jgi:hypothetical protein